jgi:hypothetical protein
MAEWAGELLRAAERGDATLGGEVRVSAPPGVAYDFLAPFARALRERHPNLSLVVSSRVEYVDLVRREADLALRTRAPTQRDLITVATLTHANDAFVAPRYRAQLPERPTLAQVGWIAWAPPFEQLPPNRELAALIPDFRPAFAADDFIVQRRAAEEGVGALFLGLVRHRFSRPTELLGDKPMAKQMQAALDKLDRGLRVGSWGQLQEWLADLDDARDDHRHVSHLFALHPGHAINAAKPDEFTAAARKTLDARGDASTGWSRAWKINFWARLLDGDRAHKLLAGLLRDSTLPNLWDTHPPFQIDGNFGASAGIVEMLLQSQHEILQILPARPDAWMTGSVSGLRARGDVTVSIDWDACGAKQFVLEAGRDGNIAVQSVLFEQPYDVRFDKGSKPRAVNVEQDLFDFHARKGGKYTFTRGASVVCDR